MTVVVLVVILILFTIVFYLFQKNRELEEKLKNLEIESDKKIKEARKASVEISRSVIKGKVAEQFAPLLKDFPYLASDCRFIGSPIDYLVVEGYSSYSDDPQESNQSHPLNIVLVDIKYGNASLSKKQKMIAKAVQDGRVSFVVIRVLEDGRVRIRNYRAVNSASDP